MAKCQRCPGNRAVKPVRERNRDGSEFVADLCEPCRHQWYERRRQIVAAARPRGRSIFDQDPPPGPTKSPTFEDILRMMREIRR